MAVYASSYYEGEPALIRNRFGKGEAYYFGGAFALDTAKLFLERLGVSEPYAAWIKAPECCEIAVRQKEGKRYLFVLNYAHEGVQIELKQPAEELTAGRMENGVQDVEKYGVRVYRLS